jgi:glycosyltransferase involved in cell wall biosynthesis
MQTASNPIPTTGHAHDVAVLLATFNGARFLPTLLDSLHEQTHRRFTLFVRDDGSDDDTAQVLSDYADSVSHPIRRLETQGKRLGPCASFSALLDAALSDADRFEYFAFCDQDDWWSPGKLEAQLRAITHAGSEHADLPILVHSDLEVVDATLHRIAPSYWQQQRVDPAANDFGALILRNVSVGCAIMINRRLAEIALPIPPSALMHDWWITLLARAAGRVEPVYDVHVKYRQHGANTLGAADPGWRRLFSSHHWRTRILNNNEFSALRPYAQAAALAQRVPGALSAEWRRRLALVSDLPQQAPLQRRISVLRSGIVPHDAVRLLAYVLKL